MDAEKLDWLVPATDRQCLSAVLNEWRVKSKIYYPYIKNTLGVIQAGGNLGVFPKGLSEVFDKVHTFEPDQLNFECMLKNCTGCTNIEFYNSGLGNKITTGRISYNPLDNCGAVQIAEGGTDLNITTIDSFNFTDIDLIWLDIEGFEVKALQGARQTIERCKPVIILENKGLIPEFPSNLGGSLELREWMFKEFNYTFVSRYMRDDLFMVTRNS